VTVANFATGTDNFFYQNETTATNASIVMSAMATTFQGVASSIVALPDGTVMTLVGVTPMALGTANAGGTLFKP
jgi:ribosomal protein L2